VLLFVDSDTWHHPSMVRDAVAMLLAEDASLLSVQPHQVTITAIERLTVPLIPWCLLTHFPVVLAQRLKWRLGAVALGQVLLLRRDAYEAIGGHASVRREVAEDLALARAVAARGMRWRVASGINRSACRMYRSASAVREGFGRNLFGTFGRHYWLVAFVWSWLAVVTIAPPLMLLGALLGELRFSIPLAAASTLLSMSTWAFVVVRNRLPVELVLLYPLVMAFALLLALESLRQGITKQSTWRGRQIA
jgi:chlorobactene glucosyltransferase